MTPWLTSPPGPAVRLAPPCAVSGAKYQLALPRDARLELARGWLWLGIIALIGSGVFSVVLVLFALALASVFVTPYAYLEIGRAHV